MSAGVPLTDDDRLPWLALIRSTAERISRDEWNDSGYKIKDFKEGGLGRPGVIIACSALKKWYRDILRGTVEANPPTKDDLVSLAVPNPATIESCVDIKPLNHPQATAEAKAHHPATANLLTLFLYCHGSPETLQDRISNRKGHFMGKQMLESQLKTLEDPRGEDGVAWVDIKATKEEVGDRAVKGVRSLVEGMKD